MMHGFTHQRIVPTGNGQQNKQSRFHCDVHGWYILLVFPNAAEQHSKCCDESPDAGAFLEIPKLMEEAA